LTFLTGLSELDDEAVEQAGGHGVGRLASSFRRPPPETDQLCVVKQSDKTETTGVEHPPVTTDSTRQQRSDEPLVHLGVVATGNC